MMRRRIAPRHVPIVAILMLAGCAASPPAPTRTHDAPTPGTPDLHLASWEPIGRSVEGRPIEAITLGGSGRRILIIGGIHGDEPEGGRTMNAVAAYVAALGPRAAVRIVRDTNPDGTAARSRTNARGIDLNRNWPARNFSPSPDRGAAPLSEPETRALAAEIERFRPGVILVCHAARAGPFVNFDGPAGDLAAAFADAAATRDSRWRVVPSMGYPTPGSLGSLLGVDRGLPILTVEFARGHDADAAWIAMRDGLGAVLELSGSGLAK